MPNPFEAELAALEALSTLPPASTLEPVRKALAARNNFLVSKAAKLAVTHNHGTLLPELLEAIPRFFKDPLKSDPQCWAKNALIQALSHFEYQQPAPFLAGLQHIQLEPVWGGTSDTAGTLRGHAAFGLVQCRTLSNTDVLTHLLPLFADKEKLVQLNAARAIEQIGTDPAMLLLRLRAELASGDAEVLGACYTGVLHLEGPSAIPWAARFLRPQAPDDTSTEAAFAIADTHCEDAFTTLKLAWTQTRDNDFRGTLMTAIALTRQDTAYTFLLDEAADGNPTARQALEDTAAPQDILNRLQAL